MSTFTIPGLHGKTRAAVTVAKHAGQSSKQLKQHIAAVDADNRALIAASENDARDIHTALIRGCQDAIALAAALTENQQLKTRVKELGDKVIRAEADKQRLRQAVINARPRITYTVQRLDRPYVSHVQVPYPVPGSRETGAA